jgi:hypothetical protein
MHTGFFLTYKKIHLVYICENVHVQNFLCYIVLPVKVMFLL